MHPYFTSTVAEQRRSELRIAADRRRLRRSPRTTRPVPSGGLR